MIKKIYVCILLMCGFTGFAAERSLKGTVYEYDKNQKQQPLPFANVYWEGTQKGTVTDVNGRFEIGAPKSSPNKLIISFIGYKNDTVEIQNTNDEVEIFLSTNQAQELKTVNVVSRTGGSYISQLRVDKSEVITTAGLCQLACCNLAESFENSATVDVGYSDAVSGARQIQMLGLTGIYSQLMYENMPFVRGLSAPFGLNYVPGSYMESIQISKGTSSVVNGFEAITGQINLEYRKPQKEGERLFINLFGNSELKGEANAIGKVKINDHLSTSLLGHYSYMGKEHDMYGGENGDGDGFMDQPKTQQINLINRWNYETDKFKSATSLMFLNDRRIGGQMGFDPDKNRNDSSIYGFENKTQRYQIFTKNGFVLNEHSSIGTQLSATYMDIASFYGFNTYDGTETNLYGNIIYNNVLTEKHKIDFGISLQWNDFNEKYNRADYLKTEVVPGVFGQYTWNPLESFSMIAGLRYDYNNYFDQNMITPRLHLRWNLNDEITFRASGGKGYRSPNVFAENMGLMASSRQFHIADNIQMEEAWNYGGSIVYRFDINEERKFLFTIDAFRTQFENQLIVDLDQDAYAVYFYNLDGKSYSNSIQAEINWDVFRGLNLTLATRYNDVKSTFNGELLEKPYVSKWKELAVISYKTPLDKWQFDLTLQANGKSRLPNTNGAREEYSEAYGMAFFQITRRFKNIDIYAGCENIFDYTQPNPIIDAQDPYGPDFDASVIWGPLMGRVFYAGLRWTIN